MATTNTAFRPWVPSWLRAIVGFSMLIPVILINGAYTGSSVDISSALGVLSEDISMAYYATSAGMAAAYPLIPKIRSLITTKTVLLCGFGLQALLSFICANTTIIEIVIGVSFMIGFLKAFALLEVIIILNPILTPKNVRSEFYAFFYPMTFSIGQISMLLTSELAYNYQWQYMYYLVIALLLIGIIMVLLCFRYGSNPIHIPFKDMDGKSLALISCAILLIVYVCTYGKVRDWFSSTDIIICTLLITPLFWLFIRRQQKSRTPYVNLQVLKRQKAIIGLLFMFIGMGLSASSVLVSAYATSILKVDSIHANGLNLIMIPGFIVGAFICFWWLRWQIWRFRVLASWGMACFVGYFAMLYFGLTIDGTYEFLYWPMFLKGIGMMIIFIAFGVYSVEDLNPKLMNSNAFFIISIRSLIAPVMGATFLTNMLYRMQQRNIIVLGDTIDLQNSISSSRYNDLLNSALKQGMPMTEAQQTAIGNLYSIVNMQSLLLSIKIILGYLLIFSIVVMIITRFTPFHKTLKVKVVKSGDDVA